MPESKVTLKVLNPRGRNTRMEKKPVSSRLGTLDGSKIGVLSNTKNGGEILWPFVEDALKRRASGVQFRTWRLHFGLPPEQKEPTLKEIAENSDAVIAFMGD